MRWGNSDLTSWLSGGARKRELNETRTAWERTEDAIASSPLALIDFTATCIQVAEQSINGRLKRPPTSFFVALATSVSELLSAEDIEPFTPKWSLIDNDARVAVEFREALVRRRRWALDFDRCFRSFSNQISSALRSVVDVLPDGWSSNDDDTSAFSVPLISLIDNPSLLIERIITAFYDHEARQLDLFKELREHFGQRITIASGFSPDADLEHVSTRLVMPTKHKATDSSELANLYLGGTPFAELLTQPVPFSIPDEARFEHCHVIGGTGHGKTQLLQRMIHADLIGAQNDGRSVVVIDSQGDFIRRLTRLDLFDPGKSGSLADRLVLIDPSDVEYPPSLNLFDIPSRRLDGYGLADRERALNGLVELYETFFGALLGAELTQKQGVIFRYLARLMLVIPGASIHTLMRLMEDGRPFKPHMDKLDGSARHFFESEFFHPSFAATKKQVLKRLWGVLSTPAFERMFAQRDNKLDLFEATQRGSIILISTAKDFLKTDGSALFGRFFISMLAQVTLERSILSPGDRTPTFAYVDEAQEYFDDTIETILSQARKYRVGMTLAHQTLDQLSPRLRSAFLSNTSLKCAGGVSAKDARSLASEFHTSPEFIESMRKRRDHTEFALWLKGVTPHALRMDVPLGFLERQPTLTEEAHDELLDQNRARYCGTRSDVLTFTRLVPPAATSAAESSPVVNVTTAPSVPRARAARETVELPPPPRSPQYPESRRSMTAGLGKGGQKHRYLQSLVKELAEQQGFRATLEASLPSGGLVDVLLEQGDERIAVEISVSTPVEHERHNLRKCLDAGFERVALVLAKSKTTQGRYAEMVIDGLSIEDRARVFVLSPEAVADFIATLAPPPPPSESMVKGWKVRVSRSSVSPDEVRERRDRLAKLVARSLRSAD